MTLALLATAGCSSPGEVLHDFDGDGSLDADDCGPDDDTIYPGAADSFGDGIDQDCDGNDGVDADGDGYASAASGGEDCSDDNPNINPADADQDGYSTCTALLDCDDSDAALTPLDADGDHYSTCTGDCDDGNSQMNPEQEEVCDLLDNDCDGVQADNEVDLDLDGDPACNDCDDNAELLDHLDLDGDSFSLCDGDCIDDPAQAGSELIYPAATDLVANGIDNNCDGIPGTDDDGDGFASAGSGGTDCDDLEPTINPAATDTVGDARDNNCDGIDGVDADGDTVASLASGGTDCNDDPADAQAPLTFPGAADVVADSIDSNCDGIAGTDDDGDQHASLASGGADCNDQEATTNPAAVDTVGDAVDNNCDDRDGVDADGDGVASLASGGTDCDDDPTRSSAFGTFPGAADVVADGYDTNCDGIPGMDEDGDQHASVTSGGTDCDDLEPTTNPAATDTVGDGTDNNCDGLDGVDADGDLHATLASGGDDCDDAAPNIFTGAADSWGNGVDEDCDGCVDTDPTDGIAPGDGIDTDCDGFAYNGPGPDWDCDDTEPTTYPGAPDTVGDAIDSNCDLIDGTDHDGDREASVASGGDDCDDTLPDTYLGAPDSLDGIDTDCDLCDPSLPAVVDASGVTHVRGDGVDADCDGYAQNAPGFDQDCNDDPSTGGAAIYPGSAEVWESAAGLLDTNCDGDLHTLLADADTAFVGEGGGDQSGRSVASAGDVDGDGLSDVLIGAHLNDDVGIYAGKTYLFLGASIAVGGTFDLSAADAAFVAENAYDYSGTSVASAGDVDGDGLSDLLIGASGNADGGSYAGKTYLFLGASIVAGGTFNLSAADASFVGESAYIYSGGSVASAGDVDGDGLSDLLIGAHANSDAGPGTGKTHLFLASSIASGGTFNLSAADASFVGENPQDYSGGSVASAGDVDGDGLSDLLIGAYANDDGGSYAGKSYLFLGASITAGGTFNLSAADASFVGENPGDSSGNSVASAGDVDGDGLDDLLIGATENDEGGNRAGKTYLVFASSIASGGTFNLSDADASFVGENAGDNSASSVTSAGDVDGDGLSDLLIGAHSTQIGIGGTNAGKSYVFLGSSIGSGGTFGLSQADAAFVGEHTGDASGSSIASAGDVDGDGLSDLLVGAMANDDGDIEAGKTYLLLSTFATPDYAGLWTVAPATTYTCGPGFVSAQLDHLVIDHVTPYATVPGMPELTMDSSSVQPGLLEGGFVTSATPDSFAVTRTESLSAGACTATWALTGSYTGTDTLSADFTATFSGSCGDCTNQSFPVTATR